jgi:predicted nucleic acid-binding protein
MAQANAPLHARLIVSDTSPLITLALADSLDLLFYADLPLYIPDGVFHEATRAAHMADAVAILAWQAQNAHRVHLVSTTIFYQYQQTGLPKRGMGELAAVEVVAQSNLAPDERALVLFEDDAATTIIAAPTTIIPISTRDYLDALEATQRIQSADAIFAEARKHATNPQARSSKAFLPDQPSEHQRAVMAALASARPIGEIMRPKPGDPPSGGTP